MAELNRGFESEALTPPAIETIPFAQAEQAYDQAATGKVKTKHVLTFSLNPNNK
jgi:hypothetical protein